MGHQKSIDAEADSGEGNTKWDIFEAGAVWAIAEVVAWMQRLDSPALALGVSAGLARKAKGAETTFRLGISQMAEAAGQEADAIRKAVRTKVRELADEYEVAPGMLPLPLPLAEGLSLVTRGKKGRRLQGEVEARALTPLPPIMQNRPEACFGERENKPDARLPRSENEPKTRFSAQENEPQACSADENEPEAHHPYFSTQTQSYVPTPPTQVGKEGGFSEEQISLLALLSAADCPSPKAEAAVQGKLAGRGETLRWVANRFEDLLRVVANDKEGFLYPEQVLAHRIKVGTVVGMLSRLPKLAPDQPQEPKVVPFTPRVSIGPPVTPTADREAQRAWEGVREALTDLMYEDSFNTWIAPLKPLGFRECVNTPVLVVGTVNGYHRNWIECSLTDEWNAAIAAAGVPGLRIDIEIDENEISRNVAL
ncbi:DnaA N-terminal domain-containing protein [Geothrix sp. PMB-07]|uniref:DnaA N-terminal domain-containing protein n=1 Tax=Geothrix sp. PMB-07 TaxID=3068640 RepID=UPI00274160DD|nr:DnaA N-terminal domain-containing protein [Geothrix sp. PMB-07]WLT30667.1 hypothetical protein Q9293_13175 [Geothrix sp. PMB-07]